MASSDIAHRLQEAEGSGRVEFKRSVLWPMEKHPLKVQGVLMRLANANAEVGGLLQLGREDNGTIVGMVDENLAPVTDPRQISGAEQKLMQVAQKLDPPMSLRWFVHPMDGKNTIVVEIPGRPKGGWYQDEQGVTKTGSASHPAVVKQAKLQEWAREGFAPGRQAYQLEVSVYTRAMIYDPALGETEHFYVLYVNIMNHGSATSYIDSIGLVFDFDGLIDEVQYLNPPNDALINRMNPKSHFSVEPGRSQAYHYRTSGMLASLKSYMSGLGKIKHGVRPNIDWSKLLLEAVVVRDELGHSYRVQVSEETKSAMSRIMMEENR